MKIYRPEGRCNISGDRIVADYELEHLADALGVTIYYLLGKE